MVLQGCATAPAPKAEAPAPAPVAAAPAPAWKQGMGPDMANSKLAPL
ncbi:MAG: sorbosone dehydrogenase family protein, partial [Burkholderiaceae bacterium]|nr:sorbosone dehydrogenase family protein [Burkholderiaceae bacterium]